MDHLQATLSKLLTCTQANSASYPQWDRNE